MIHSTNTGRSLATLLSSAFLLSVFVAPAIGTAADDEDKPRAKKRPIKLISANASPVASAASIGSVDLTSLPVLDIDPDLPSHLRPVRLYSKDGRYLDARLLSVGSEKVSVQRLSDNRIFDLPMDSLDDVSVARVETWLDLDPDATNYSIDFNVKKRMLESDAFVAAGRNFKLMKWAYDVEMTNQSRNELKGAILEYQIFYDDEVKLLRTSAYPGEGQNMRDGRDVELPALAFNGRAEFTTPALELQTYEYEPSRGDREYRRDEIIGIWIRVIKHGEVISEYKSHPAAMESLTWSEEEEIEIVVRDSFKDQFEDN